MTILVGFAPDGRGRAVLHLATLLARSAGDELVVCSVVPASWFPGEAKVDAEYQSYLEGSAGEALEHARARLPADVPATFLTHHGRSIAAGRRSSCRGWARTRRTSSCRPARASPPRPLGR